MAEEEKDQDQLAQEWAEALGEQGEAEAGAEGGGAEDAAVAAAAADDALADEWASALADQEETDLKKEKEKQFLDTKVKDAKFKDLTQEAKTAHEGTRRDLDFILDIPLEVSAELGRTKLLINELLQLGQGSVVELNKLAGEPLEIYVNGKLVARGEAVVINEKFGIRLTDIISPIERVKQLG
ncbi:MAG: flagellar motor switch protein FliN [Desulfovibrionaceae bacterium]|nr:flagellar motor switch protein FliN [Desulfovibrionaceae bacterium]